MLHFKRNKKIYISYAKTALFAVLFLLVAIPFVNKIANGGKTYTPDSRYMVVLNGEELGYVSDSSIADSALIDARGQLGVDNGGLVLVEADIETYEDATGGAVLTEAQIADKIYTALADKIEPVEDEKTAYTIRIDDFTVTLASLDEVTDLLERVKDKYNDSGEFTVELEQQDNGVYSVYKTNFVSADKVVNDAAQVLASMNGDGESVEFTEDTVVTEGVLSVDFVENIEVIETKQNSTNIVSVDEAYELVTKEHAEKGIYTVQSGDCFSAIAKAHGITMDELFALNYGYDINSMIYAGDELVVTVPASEISVQIIEERTFDEEYDAPVQYVDNNTMYIGTEKVVQNAVKGERTVVALITYVNGVESSREILSEEIIVAATPKIIERGTVTPPTYIKPVYSNLVTSPFGYRIHPIYHTNILHSGVDWGVPTGTAVRAASTGTVVQSGWNGGYGYCITIKHNDGSMTRYAHLSSISVAYGQYVQQGQVIALSGSTGNSTGPHLHFELIIGGNYVNPLDYVK